MSPTWDSDAPADPVTITAAGWVRALVRGAALTVLIFGGLALMLLLRPAERLLFGAARPLTPYITCFVCRNALRIIGVALHGTGAPMRGSGAVVANHSSWLDIFALNARKRIYFVSKSEVAGWPGIGWLARATGTVFVERRPARARSQAGLLERRLKAGHRLLFFPEGTSSDGLRVLPFKTTLFAPFFSSDLRHGSQVQPVSIAYCAPAGQPPRFYGWWGSMGFGAHLLKILSVARQGSIEIVYHAPLRVADFADRKILAAHAEKIVRDGHARLMQD